MNDNIPVTCVDLEDTTMCGLMDSTNLFCVINSIRDGRKSDHYTRLCIGINISQAYNYTLLYKVIVLKLCMIIYLFT